MPIPVLDEYYLGISILICLGWQICFFIGASITKSDKVTDFAYGTNFVGLCAILFAISQNYTPRNIIVFVFVGVWGLRLALYLFARVVKEGKDARFDGTRDKFFKFMMFWILQCITVWAISIPFTVMFSRPLSPGLGWQDILGIIIWAIGFLIETVADQQKFSFKNAPGNKSKMCTVGLWSISRHPNYFGESLCWWGLWSMATSTFGPNFNDYLYFTVLSPLYVMTILLFLSGIPTLEEPWNKKYGKDADFRFYKKSVPPFVVFIPALYAKFPNILKLLFCCEFPLYNKGFDDAAATAAVVSEGDLEKGWESGTVQVTPLYQRA